MDQKIVLAAVGAASFIGGGLVGYFAAKQTLEKSIDERVENEVAKTKYFYELRAGKYLGPLPDTSDWRKEAEIFEQKVMEAPKGEIVAYHKIVMNEDYGNVTPPDDEEEVSVIECIVDEDFAQNDSGFEQKWYSYWEDGVVTDEETNEVVDPEFTIGLGEPPFGEKTMDPDLAHVRNNELQIEFEITRQQGKYGDIHGDEG